MKKQFYLIFIFIFICVFIAQITFGFFDKRQVYDDKTVPIGSWLSLTDPVTPENVLEYLDLIDTVIETHPDSQQVEIIDYLYEIIFAEDESGELDFDNVNETFSDYNLEEIIETVNLIIEFTESFLVFDENNEPVFPEHTLVSEIEFDLGGPLLPGEHLLINKVLQTANLSDISWWSPISLQLSIEAPEGGDIADYAIEFLVDANPFASVQPFSYDYLLRDRTSWNINRARGDIKISDNVLIPVDNEIVFETTVYREKNQQFVPVKYRHLYQNPSFSGDWSRLPFGSNLYLGPPTSQYGTPIGSQQEILQYKNPKQRTGLITVGKANGTKVELKMDIPHRNPRYGDSIPLIPIIIVVSRGLELDSNGNTLPVQSDLLLEPIIKLRVIEGSVWIGD